MSDVEAEHKREEEQRREEDEILDTAEDEGRRDDATEEVRRAFPLSHNRTYSMMRTGPSKPTKRVIQATQYRLTMRNRRRSRP